MFEDIKRENQDDYNSTIKLKVENYIKAVELMQEFMDKITVEFTNPYNGTTLDKTIGIRQAIEFALECCRSKKIDYICISEITPFCSIPINYGPDNIFSTYNGFNDIINFIISKAFRNFLVRKVLNGDGAVLANVKISLISDDNNKHYMINSDDFCLSATYSKSLRFNLLYSDFSSTSRLNVLRINMPVSKCGSDEYVSVSYTRDGPDTAVYQLHNSDSVDFTDLHREEDIDVIGYSLLLRDYIAKLFKNRHVVNLYNFNCNIGYLQNVYEPLIDHLEKLTAIYNNHLMTAPSAPSYDSFANIAMNYTNKYTLNGEERIFDCGKRFIKYFVDNFESKSTIIVPINFYFVIKEAYNSKLFRRDILKGKEFSIVTPIVIDKVFYNYDSKNYSIYCISQTVTIDLK